MDKGYYGKIFIPQYICIVSQSTIEMDKGYYLVEFNGFFRR